MAAEPVIRYSPAELFRRYDPDNKIEHYLELLKKENERLNLVSRETVKYRFTDLRRLAVESLIPLQVIEARIYRTYLDIGSGGGIPAVPILVSGRIEKAALVERTQKKAAALRRMLLALDITAEIMPESFEEIRWSETFHLITLRLVNLTPKILSRILALLSPGGHFIHYAETKFPVEFERIQRTIYRYVSGDGQSQGCFALYHKKL